jgi:hypothetical protein
LWKSQGQQGVEKKGAILDNGWVMGSILAIIWLLLPTYQCLIWPVPFSSLLLVVKRDKEETVRMLWNYGQSKDIVQDERG